ncbi:MAG: hypothetical protein EA370_04095 [Wenzhouxiangella sp.]|nr:MAG: hypothetical protein EA370_04095 [Wenzhouxiangella sp.]
MFSESTIARSRRFRGLKALPLLVALALSANPAAAGVVVVGSGSNLLTGSGQIELGCGDMEIAGSLSGEVTGARNINFTAGAALTGAVLSLSGDWINNGPQALDAIVDWRDGCGVTASNMLGSSDLPALNITSESGREVRFEANAEQRIVNSLGLTGTPDTRLRLRSTDPMLYAGLTLDFGASQLIDSVDVARIDSSAGQSIAPGDPADYNSVRAGPVRNWFTLPPIPIPTLGLVSSSLLVLIMILIGLFHQRQRPTNFPE